MILTYRYRVKDGSASTRRALRAQARAVNFVWNYCCQIDREANARWKAGKHTQRPGAFDLSLLCLGTSKALGIHSDCINAICARFVDARHRSFPRTPRFRSAKRNLDWIPVSMFRRSAKLADGVLTFRRRRYHVWFNRPIPANGKPRSWEFSCDSRGRWYVNIAVELPEVEKKTGPAVGIDLGLKALATLSTGEKIEMPGFYRKAEAKLARLQSFKLRSRARALTVKVANQRNDYLHRVSARLVRDFARIVIGDVRPSTLDKTMLAKSIHDAGWTTLRQMLLYKAMAQGAIVDVVSEYYSSATCSACAARSGPKGITGLRVRAWVCENCGAPHDRDVNAALNILLGAERRPPAAGIPA